MEKVIAVDLGGTKFLVGVVDRQGNIIDKMKGETEPERGPKDLIEELSNTINGLKDNHQNIGKVGIASAGPLHPAKGLLMNPTNMTTSGSHWGVVPIVDQLKKSISLEVYLENDAAAAVLAEHWLGSAKGTENLLVMTLGTGVGIGVICNGELVRSGRGLHPEASHIYINAYDSTAPSGAKDFGSIEAYLAGPAFCKRWSKIWGEKNFDGEEFIRRVESQEPKVFEALEEYAKNLARAINSYVVLFSPEVVLLSGGFSRIYPHIEEKCLSELEKLLVTRREGVDLMPTVRVSSIQNNMGLLGGAKVAFSHKN